MADVWGGGKCLSRRDRQWLRFLVTVGEMTATGDDRRRQVHVAVSRSGHWPEVGENAGPS